MRAVLVTLDEINPNRDALQRWLQVAGVDAVHDRPASFRYGQWAVQTAPMAARDAFASSVFGWLSRPAPPGNVISVGPLGIRCQF